ncbi:hypothetical protein EVAR_48207_1 [Eumeta japonica]|uniref:Uncharacterized protein n=1 Tax=Eumeta variegata TaxID=151549 RepID=A0A4C1XX10_EUMVA|nr:hypothetical protein EVAR_48207_1 [Eumeta japonica]
MPRIFIESLNCTSAPSLDLKLGARISLKTELDLTIKSGIEKGTKMRIESRIGTEIKNSTGIKNDQEDGTRRKIVTEIRIESEPELKLTYINKKDEKNHFLSMLAELRVITICGVSTHKNMTLCMLNISNIFEMECRMALVPPSGMRSRTWLNERELGIERRRENNVHKRFTSTVSPYWWNVLELPTQISFYCKLTTIQPILEFSVKGVQEAEKITGNCPAEFTCEPTRQRITSRSLLSHDTLRPEWILAKTELDLKDIRTVKEMRDCFNTIAPTQRIG